MATSGTTSDRMSNGASSPSSPSSTTHQYRIKKLRASGAFPSFNPTNVQFQVKFKNPSSSSSTSSKASEQDATKSDSESSDSPADLALLWRSRDNRKGRGSIAIPRTQSNANANANVNANANANVPFKQPPRLSNSVKEISRNIWRMCTVFPYWDMAFGVGFSYTIGSIVWTFNGAFAWLPIAFPKTEFAGEIVYGGGITAFLGVLMFEAGAGLALLEAINDGSYHGTAMRRLLNGNEQDAKQLVDEKLKTFFAVSSRRRVRDEEEMEERLNNVDPEAGWKEKDGEKQTLSLADIYPPSKAPAPAPRRGAMDLGAEEGESSTYTEFRWIPTWHAFKTHHIYEIGFLACFLQFIGATIFLLTGTVALPGVLSLLNQVELNALYWIPQMIASAFFIASSALFLFETQEKWYKPNPKVLGWWIGLFSTVGSIGFEMCGGLGPAYGNSKAVYQMALSSFWGSCCFLVSSVLQWYEALNKHPVEELFNEVGEMKSSEVHPL